LETTNTSNKTNAIFNYSPLTAHMKTSNHNTEGAAAPAPTPDMSLSCHEGSCYHTATEHNTRCIYPLNTAKDEGCFKRFAASNAEALFDIMECDCRIQPCHSSAPSLIFLLEPR
jgi:hypothetical protein